MRTTNKQQSERLLFVVLTWQWNDFNTLFSLFFSLDRLLCLGSKNFFVETVEIIRLIHLFKMIFMIASGFSLCGIPCWIIHEFSENRFITHSSEFIRNFSIMAILNHEIKIVMSLNNFVRIAEFIRCSNELFCRASVALPIKAPN